MIKVRDHVNTMWNMGTNMNPDEEAILLLASVGEVEEERLGGEGRLKGEVGGRGG